jgi:hypothetical protein
LAIILNLADIHNGIILNMPVITIEQLKAKFESGDWPRSVDYVDLIDTLYSIPDDSTIDGGTP